MHHSFARLGAAFAVLGTALVVIVPVADAKPATVKVMSRNLDLGAGLQPATKVDSLQALVNAAGKILHDVDSNDFRIRAKGLAAEIVKANPDLVGLQEAALWRTEPCDRSPIPPAAATVRYDYLELLLAELNKGKKRYALAVTKPELDFEVWVNADGDEQTSGPNCPLGSELNGRLTMRDAILVRRGAVKISKPRSGTFKTLLQVRPGGVAIDVTRGWTAVEAQVGSHRFKFVNTHTEAFDNSPSGNHTNRGTDVGNGQIREAQARELAAGRGPATGKLPVVLLGDLNSDTKTEVKPGDALAYRALLKAGFVERATLRPLACCLKGDSLAVSGEGRLSDLDHTVDHVMTNAPKKVKLVSSSVTGRTPVNGFWDADHAGLVSTLSLR